MVDKQYAPPEARHDDRLMQVASAHNVADVGRAPEVVRGSVDVCVEVTVTKTTSQARDDNVSNVWQWLSSEYVRVHVNEGSGAATILCTIIVISKNSND